MPTYQIQFRGDTSANWTAENPVLLAYEMGIEVTADGRLLWKIGDGATPWLGLGYASGPVGPSPDYEWTGTSLRFKSNDGAWGEWVNLVGPSVAYRWDGTALQLQNPDGTWGAAVDLRGPEGPSGTSKPATPASLGGVIPGAGLHIDGAGRLDSSLAWSHGGNYPYPVLVQGGNGALYLWKRPSGPGVPGSDGRAVGARDPLRDDGTYWAALLPDKYDLCEFYYFRHPDLKPGFFPAMGGLLENAPAQCPRAWAYLQTEEGQKLCVTEAEWQAMTTATWATLADGSTVGWNGIGGAPWYVVDTANGTLRLPDLRGMYIEAAGFDSLGVGGTHLDGVREVIGVTDGFLTNGAYSSGAFYTITRASAVVNNSGGTYTTTSAALKLSRVVPTAAKNQPRAWGALACVYLGQPS